MRRLHAYVPHLSLGLAAARRSEPFPPGPLVLGGKPWDPGPVIDASPDARALGVRRGMPLGSAHRLVPEATFIDPDPEADRGTAEAVFEALGRSSPSLAGSVDPRSVSFGLFEVGIDGLGPLWGPELVLAERLVDAVRTAVPGDIAPRVGIAGTHFAATIAAMAAEPAAPLIVPPGGEAAFLAVVEAHRAMAGVAVVERKLRQAARGLRMDAPQLRELHLRCLHQSSDPGVAAGRDRLAFEVVGVAAVMLPATARSPELRERVELEGQPGMARGHQAMIGEALAGADVAGDTERGALMRSVCAVHPEALELGARWPRNIVVTRDPGFRSAVAAFATDAVVQLKTRAALRRSSVGGVAVETQLRLVRRSNAEPARHGL